MTIPAAERRQLAALLGCNEQYLYQCLTGRNAMQPIDAARAERLTGGRLRRWDVRTKDWHLIWPELVDAQGAPKAPPDEPNSLPPAAGQNLETVKEG